METFDPLLRGVEMLKEAMHKDTTNQLHRDATSPYEISSE